MRENLTGLIIAFARRTTTVVVFLTAAFLTATSARATDDYILMDDGTGSGPAGTLESVMYQYSSKIGIGTTAPYAKFEVKGSGATSSTYGIIARDSSNYAIFWVRDDGNVFITADMVVDEGAVFNDDNGWFNDFQVKGAYHDDAFFVDASASHVGIRKSAPAYELDVDGAGNFLGLLTEEFYASDYVHVGTDFIGVYDLEVADTAAKTGGGTWSNPSDIRLKTNIVPLQGALGAIDSLEPVEFEWIDSATFGEGPEAGFIAQDVEQVFPDWVIGVTPEGVDPNLIPVDDEMKTLFFPHEFFALIVGAVKELKAENDSWRTENAYLRQEIYDLKQLVCLDHPTAMTCNN